MPIICPNGHANDPGNRFCDQCGAQLPAAPATEAAATPVATATPAPTPGAAPSGDTTAAGSLVCSTCGQENLPGTAFCENCGAPLPPPEPAQAPDTNAAPAAVQATGGNVTCPNCGFDNEPGNAFCEQCGAALAGSQTEASAPPAPTTDESGATAGGGDEEAIAAPGAQSQPATEEVQPPADTSAETALPPIPEATSSTEAAAPVEAPVVPQQPATPATPAPAESGTPSVAAIGAGLAVAAIGAGIAAATATASETQQCSNCGSELPPNAKFCLECGTKVERAPEMVRPTHCQNCGAELPQNAKFCLECGTKVEMIPAGTARPGAPSADATYQQQAGQSQGTGLPVAADIATEHTTTPETPSALDVATQPATPAAPETAQPASSSARTYDAAPVATPQAASDVATPATPPPPPVQQVQAQSAPPIAQPAQPISQPAQPASQGGPRLVSTDGTTISLPPQSELVVGREDPVSGIHPDIDMTPHGGEAGGVSRRHAVLRQQGGQWSLVDLDSTNYTRVDGNRIAPNTEVPLHDGARIQFGRVQFEFYIQ